MYLIPRRRYICAAGHSLYVTRCQGCDKWIAGPVLKLTCESCPSVLLTTQDRCKVCGVWTRVPVGVNPAVCSERCQGTMNQWKIDASRYEALPCARCKKTKRHSEHCRRWTERMRRKVAPRTFAGT